MAQGVGNNWPKSSIDSKSPFRRPNTVIPNISIKIQRKDIEAMNNRDLIDLIWECFGVSIEYDSDRASILKMLYQLSS